MIWAVCDELPVMAPVPPVAPVPDGVAGAKAALWAVSSILMTLPGSASPAFSM